MNTYPDWATLSKEQRIIAIRPMAANGLSAGIIAKRFTGASRNAIIGYCERYGITLGKGQPRRVEKTKGSRGRPKKAQAAKVAAKAITAVEKAVVPYAPEKSATPKVAPDIADLGPLSKSRAFDPIDGIKPVSLENLGAHSCHWPVNGFNGHEPLFCGVSTSKLYCASHARLAYSPHGH